MSRDRAEHLIVTDVVVAGLGALGSAAAWRLTERGLRVVGLDRHRPPHNLGSTHGAGRVIREAFFEAPFYVPLVRRAYEGWAALEELSGRTLLQTTGVLMAGPPDGGLVRGALEAVRAHGIEHRVLEADEIERQLPGIAPERGMVGVVEERGGVLHPERCVEAALEQARLGGAELRLGTPLLGAEVDEEEVVVRTEEGEIRAGTLVLAAGPWMTAVTEAAGGAPLPLEVVRQVTHRFHAGAAGSAGLAGPHLVTIWEYARDRFFYTVPEEGGAPGSRTVKVAVHYGGKPVDPDAVDRSVAPGEVEEARALVDRFLPGAAGAHLESRVCLYTNTPDHHFVVGRDPDSPRLMVAGGGSGHAFKFAPALGELVTALMLDEEPFMDMAPFRPGRFGRP